MFKKNILKIDNFLNFVNMFKTLLYEAEIL